MTPLRKAIALLNMGLQVETVRRHLLAMGLEEAAAQAVLAAAELKLVRA